MSEGVPHSAYYSYLSGSHDSNKRPLRSSFGTPKERTDPRIGLSLSRGILSAGADDIRRDLLLDRAGCRDGQAIALFKRAPPLAVLKQFQIVREMARYGHAETDTARTFKRATDECLDVACFNKYWVIERERLFGYESGHVAVRSGPLNRCQPHADHAMPKMFSSDPWLSLGEISQPSPLQQGIVALLANERFHTLNVVVGDLPFDLQMYVSGKPHNFYSSSSAVSHGFRRPRGPLRGASPTSVSSI
jgi:hypothetical protein